MQTLFQFKTEGKKAKTKWLNVDQCWVSRRRMGAPAAPVLINIYDSDMTHEFVVGSRDPACGANSRLPLLQHPSCRSDIKEEKKIKAKHVSFI